MLKAQSVSAKTINVQLITQLAFPALSPILFASLYFLITWDLLPSFISKTNTLKHSTYCVCTEVIWIQLVCSVQVFMSWDRLTRAAGRTANDSKLNNFWCLAPCVSAILIYFVPKIPSIFNFIENEDNTNSRTFTSSLSLLYSTMIWNMNMEHEIKCTG